MHPFEHQLRDAGLAFESNRGVGARLTIDNRIVSIQDHAGSWIVIAVVCRAECVAARVVLEAAAELEEAGALALVTGYYVARYVMIPGTPIVDLVLRAAGLAARLEAQLRAVQARAIGLNAHYCS
ncbi:MAG: hypothetical protein ABI867_05295 [Kofleriaceae bacterium]